MSSLTGDPNHRGQFDKHVGWCGSNGECTEKNMKIVKKTDGPKKKTVDGSFGLKLKNLKK